MHIKTLYLSRTLVREQINICELYIRYQLEQGERKSEVNYKTRIILFLRDKHL